MCMNREIEYVVAIAEHRSFSVAAAELHVSQPALSRLVGTLEERLGLKLFERKSHGVVLTHAGERYYKGALEVLKKERALAAEMERLRLANASALRVGIIRHPEQRYLAQCVEEFRALHPGIELNIIEQLSRDVEWGVRNEKFDLGLMSPPYIMEKLKYTPYETSHLILVVPTDRLPPRLKVYNDDSLPFPWVDIRDFANTPFVLQSPTTRLRSYIDKFFARECFTPRIGLITQGSSDALRFAVQGMGVCVLTPGYVYRVRAEGLVSVFCIGTPPATVTHGVVVKKGRTLPLCASDFIRLYFASRGEQHGHEQLFPKGHE